MLLLELEVMSGTVAGKRIAVSPPGGMIGRDPVCSVFLPDRRVSGYHAELSFENDQWRLQDAGSTNGTYIGSFPVGRSPIPLPPTGIIQVADVRLRFFTRMAEVPVGSDRPEDRVAAGDALPTLMGHPGRGVLNGPHGGPADAFPPIADDRRIPNPGDRPAAGGGNGAGEPASDDSYEDPSGLRDLFKMARKGDLASLLDVDFDLDPGQSEEEELMPSPASELVPRGGGHPAVARDSGGSHPVAARDSVAEQAREARRTPDGGRTPDGSRTPDWGRASELGLTPQAGPRGLPKTVELHLGLADGNMPGQRAGTNDSGIDPQVHEKLQREHVTLRTRYASLEEELARLQPALKGLKQENTAHLRALQTLNTALEEARAAQKRSEEAARQAPGTPTIARDVFDRTLTYLEGFGEQLDALILALSRDGDIPTAKSIAEELSLTLADLHSLVVYGRQQFPTEE